MYFTGREAEAYKSEAEVKRLLACYVAATSGDATDKYADEIWAKYMKARMNHYTNYSDYPIEP